MKKTVKTVTKNEKQPNSPVSTLGIKSILVPTDFSPAAAKALKSAIEFARLCGAKLTLLHVVEPAVTPDFAKAFPLSLESDEMKEECKRELDMAAERAGVPLEMQEEPLVRFGRAFHEIVSAARTRKSDLIIIATHGRTGLKHVLMGSTAERVVQHAPCPVLVVRSRGCDFFK